MIGHCFRQSYEQIHGIKNNKYSSQYVSSIWSQEAPRGTCSNNGLKKTTVSRLDNGVKVSAEDTVAATSILVDAGPIWEKNQALFIDRMIFKVG